MYLETGNSALACGSKIEYYTFNRQGEKRKQIISGIRSLVCVFASVIGREIHCAFNSLGHRRIWGHDRTPLQCSQPQ